MLTANNENPAEKLAMMCSDNLQGGDIIFLKVQSYHQLLVARRGNVKFTPRQYGLYAILKKVGQVSCEKYLPDNTSIHLVFQISQLKFA